MTEDSANEDRCHCIKSIDVFPKSSNIVLSVRQSEEGHIRYRPQLRIPQRPTPGISAEVGNQWGARTTKIRSDTRKCVGEHAARGCAGRQ
jgi:hypothetical protein